MNILVTGGAGYIGSHTARMLAESGHQLVVYDNLSRGHRWAVRWGPLVQGDLNDRALLAETLHKNKIDAVVHFAAYALVGESMKLPALYFRNNTAGSLTLLECMQEAGVGVIVFSSTCATYGDPVKLPLSEDHPQNPVNAYGESKFLTEKMLKWQGHAHGLKWAALRYFNACGGHPDGTLGEVHEPETHLIPNVLRAVKGELPYLEMYGTDYPTPDGTAIRDYIHILDLADAHLKALDLLSKGGDSCALNLGTGTGNSVREVVQAVERVTGKKVPVKESPRRAGDPPELVAGPAKAFQTLNWTPRYSDIQTVVETAWKWELNKSKYMGGA